VSETSVPQSLTGRATHGRVDGSGLYFSRLVRVGPYVFFGGPAVDELGRLVAEVAIAPPYHLSPAAHITEQTKFIYDRLAGELAQVGSSINHVLQVEQFIPHKIYADGYLNTSRGPGAMERGRPASAVVATGDLMPPGTVVDPTGIAIIPGGGVEKEILPETSGFQDSLRLDKYGHAYEEEGPFNEVVAAGPYVFTIGDQVLDWETGDIPDEVKVADYVWWGSEIRNETEFLLDRLERYLKRSNSTMDDVVHSTIYLYNIGDFYEFDRAWRSRFPNDPPARTVVAARGLGIPRAERPDLTHAEKGIRIEHLTQSSRPGHGATKEIIQVDGTPVGHESIAVKAGPFVWASGLYATRHSTLETAPDARSQLELILTRLDEIAQAAGTSLTELVRLRAFVTDPADTYAVHAAVRSACPDSPPNVDVTGVEAPLPIPGCSLVVDAVLYAAD
jgi:enamine deaminase RidA (YjgF/YER057c/UK114 family)